MASLIPGSDSDLTVAINSFALLGSVNADPVPPSHFGGQAGNICLGQNSAWGTGTGCNFRHPYAGTDTIAAINAREINGAGRGIEFLEDHCRIVERASEQDDAELIAAKQADHIAFTQVTGQGSSHAPQQGVAGNMARGIVDHFQPVEVDKGQGVPDARVTALHQSFYKLLLEG